MTKPGECNFDRPAETSAATSLSLMQLRRAVIAWLVSSHAKGIGLRVPTRISAYMADVAGFWSKVVPCRRGDSSTRILQVDETIVVECRRSRKECWPDCANSEELAPHLGALNTRRDELEMAIRESEPGLQACDMLFEEYAEWDYAQSSNMDYHDVCRQIRVVQDALYGGTRLEMVLQAAIADRCYLAVPEGTVLKGELAAGWGLLWVAEDLQVTEMCPALVHDCPDEIRTHLVQNIAAANLRELLFANGIDDQPGTPNFRPPPRKRPATRRRDAES